MIRLIIKWIPAHDHNMFNIHGGDDISREIQVRSSSAEMHKMLCNFYLFYQSFPASFWRFLQLGSACSVHHLPEYFCQHNKTDGVWGFRSNIGKVSRVQLLSFRASQQRLGQPTQWPSWARIRSTWSGQTTGTNWPSMVFFPSLSSQSPTLGNVITTFKNTVYKKHTTQSCFLSKNSWELQRCLKSSSEGFQKHDLFIGVRQTKLMVWFPASYSITQTFESLFILFIFHQLERLKLE